MDAEDSFIFCNDALPVNSFPAFETMRRNGDYCDLTVKVGEKSISAHRMVIAANIPYFQSMLDRGGAGCTTQEITIQKMDPDAVESLIEYAYSGKVKITPSNVKPLLSSSKHLQVDIVRDACCDFLKKRLHPNNVLSIRESGDTMGCSTLVETTDWYVRDNFDEVSRTEEFLQLPFSYIQELICRDDLCVTREERVLEAVFKWVKRYPDERKIKLPQLLSSIRMPFITLRYLSDHVAKEELIQESMTCRDLIDEAKNYHLFPRKMSDHCKFTSHPRCIKDYSAAQALSSVAGIYAVSNITPSECAVLRFDSKTEEWHDIGIKTAGLHGNAVVGMGHKLYVFGGTGSRCVNVFDLTTLAWTVTSPMKSERYSAGAGALHGKLYVCGGCDYLGSSLSAVECYDQGTKIWTNVTAMSKRRHGAGVVALGKHIYVLGGKLNSNILDNGERLDPSNSGKWAEIPSMRSPRAGFGACTMNGRIYVCGGITGPYCCNFNEVYDPLIDNWYNIASLRISRHNLSSVSHRGKLYTFGGKNESERLNSYEIYDSENNEWHKSDTLVCMENFIGVVAINDP